MEEKVLVTQNLTKRFGGLVAVSSFSFYVREGELLGLIGPNGAGKTTVFNLLTGILKPNDGKVYFCDENITMLPPHEIARRGLIRTFQNIRLMPGLSVKENLFPAFHLGLRYSLLEAIFHTRGFRIAEGEMQGSIYSTLELLGISEYADVEVSDLPYGIQRKVELARALCLRPKLLLLDEPTAGLNPREANEIVDLINMLWKERNLSMVVIEHNMQVIMSICQRIVVMDQGKIIAEGPPEEIQRNPLVIKAYLGERTLSLKKTKRASQG